MTRRKEIDPDAILDVAEAVIVELGAHRLTLDLVASRAGISKGGLAYNFKSKDELISAIVGRELARFRREVECRTDQFRDSTHPDLLARIAVSRSEDKGMISKAASALVAFQLSEMQREASKQVYQAELSAFDLSQAQGRKGLVAFLALEGLFFLKGLNFIDMDEDEWQQVHDIISESYG